MDCSTPGFSVLHYLPEFAHIHIHRVNDIIQPSHPLLSPSPAFSLSPGIRVFSNESALRTRWPKYWSFSFSISASKDHSGLTSFRIDWFDLLAEIPSAGHCGGSYIKRMGLRVEAGRDGQQTRTQEPEQRDVQQRCTRDVPTREEAPGLSPEEEQVLAEASKGGWKLPGRQVCRGGP